MRLFLLLVALYGIWLTTQTTREWIWERGKRLYGKIKGESLKAYRIKKLGLKKHNIFSKNILDVQQYAGMEKTNNLKIVSATSAITGFIIAFALNNYFLVPILAGLGYLIPLWVAKCISYQSTKVINLEIEITLSIITSTYLRTEDIVQSIRENIGYIKPPINAAFNTFLMQVDYFNPDLDKAITNLQESFKNDVFIEWCKTIKQCNIDRVFKGALNGIVEKFSDIKEMQLETDTLMRATVFDFMTMAAIIIINVPALFFINYSWFLLLITSFTGKLIITLSALVVMFGVNKAVTLLEPVKIKR